MKSLCVELITALVSQCQSGSTEVQIKGKSLMQGREEMHGRETSDARSVYRIIEQSTLEPTEIFKSSILWYAIDWLIGFE